LDREEFIRLDKQIKAEIPGMTDRQLIHVERWGERSRQEQDRRFPELYESGKFEELLENYPGDNPEDDPE